MINTKLSKGLKVVIGIFIFFAMADLILTYMNFKYIPYLESNPLYLAFKSMIPIIIVNIMLVFLLIYSYNDNKGKNFARKFFVTNIVTWIAVARLIAIKGNIKVFMAQPSLEVAQAVPMEAKLTSYALLTAVYIIAPLVISQIMFFLFTIDHEIKLKKT